MAGFAAERTASWSAESFVNQDQQSAKVSFCGAVLQMLVMGLGFHGAEVLGGFGAGGTAALLASPSAWLAGFVPLGRSQVTESNLSGSLANDSVTWESMSVSLASDNESQPSGEPTAGGAAKVQLCLPINHTAGTGAAVSSCHVRGLP